MNTNVETTNFSGDELAEIRAQVKGVIETTGMTQAAAAKEADVAYSTFSAFLNGNYAGDNDKPASSIQIWLSSRKEQQRVSRAMPNAPRFLMLPSAAAFVDALRFAQMMPDICVIAGAAGIGKTEACRHYASTNPNVWHAVMEPNTATLNTMLSEVCDTMGIIERSQAKLSAAIKKKMTGTGGLLIVDEAQHLSTPALDQLRTIADKSGTGLAVVGNESVYSRLEGGGRKSEFAQIFSRVGMRVTQPRTRASDVCELLKAWGIDDKDELKFLKAIAQKPGALRGLTKIIQVASLLAGGASEQRALKHYKAAWDRLTTSSQPA